MFRRYLVAFNDGDLDAFDDLVAPDYRNHNPSSPDPAPGPEGLKPIVQQLREQAPDLRFEEVQLVAEGDLVAAHLIVHGFGPDPVQPWSGVGRARVVVAVVRRDQVVKRVEVAVELNATR